jgi:hypothetical protein
VQLVSMLATAEGQWIGADSRELLAYLGDPNPDFDAAAFAVRNLGFVRYDSFPGKFAQITLFPKRVSPLALAAAQERVASGETSIVFRVDYLDHETKTWRQELAMNAREAVGRLNRLCGSFATAPASDIFAFEPQRLESIMADETHHGHPLLRKWRSSFHRFDETVLPFMARHGLAVRGMIIGVDAKRPDPIFRFIGEGFLVYGDDFFLRAVGERVMNQPDKEYGAWVSPFYTEVATTWTPRFDRCAANISHASRQYMRYERLILPWSADSGEVFLTLSTRFLDDDDGAASTDKVDAKKAAKSS